MVVDLPQWLRAQLDEDERTARRAAELCGCHPPVPSWSFQDGDGPTDGRILVDGDPHPDLRRRISRKKWNGSYDGLFMAEHVVRHDPARVLREIDSKRRIIAAYESYDREAPELDVPESVLRLLAAPYSDRPGYREEWAP